MFSSSLPSKCVIFLKHNSALACILYVGLHFSPYTWSEKDGHMFVSGCHYGYGRIVCTLFFFFLLFHFQKEKKYQHHTHRELYVVYKRKELTLSQRKKKTKKYAKTKYIRDGYQTKLFQMIAAQKKSMHNKKKQSIQQLLVFESTCHKQVGARVRATVYSWANVCSSESAFSAGAQYSTYEFAKVLIGLPTT